MEAIKRSIELMEEMSLLAYELDLQARIGEMDTATLKAYQSGVARFTELEREYRAIVGNRYADDSLSELFADIG